MTPLETPTPPTIVRRIGCQAAAWQAMNRALDAYARGEFTAEDVLAIGFRQQEELEDAIG